MQDVSNWDRDTAKFTLVLVVCRSVTGDIRQLGNYKALCISFCLFTFALPDTRFNSLEELVVIIIVHNIGDRVYVDMSLKNVDI